jgi:2-hydroxychromene-2-carboxylate isomerase
LDRSREWKHNQCEGQKKWNSQYSNSKTDRVDKRNKFTFTTIRSVQRLGGAISRACWEKGANLSDPRAIQVILEELNLDAVKLLEMAASPEIKAALKENTQATIECGVFGVPTFIVDDELFWGCDRLPFLRDYLNGILTSSRNEAEVFFNRPESAARL